MLKIDDLYNIAAAIDDAGYGGAPIEILIHVPSKDIMEKVNEEYFYANNGDGTPPDVDTVEVSVGDVKFRYIIA